MRWIGLFAVLLSGCLGLTGPDCVNETRFVAVRGALALAGSPADTGTASIDLDEARNHRTKNTASREIMYFVRAPNVDRSQVTAIHVHQKSDDRLFFSVPIDTLASPVAITTTYTRQPFPGSAVPWTEIYETVGSGGAYLDVHVGGAQPRVLRADLARPADAAVPDWRAFQHAYCS